MGRVSLYFPAVMMALVVTALLSQITPSLAIEDATAPPLPSYNPPPTPACLEKPMNCISNYLKNIDLTTIVDPTQPICCPEWKEVIENDRKCFCDALVSSNSTTMTNTTDFDSSLKNCDIDASADTLCQAGEVASNTSGSGSGSGSDKWPGLLFGLILLALRS